MKQNAEQAVLDIVEFNNMIDIMKEFAEIMNLSTDDLKKIVGDGIIKVSHNGKPIIDIENGVDKLALKKEEPKKEEPKKEEFKKKHYVSPTVETPYTCTTQNCTCPETTVTYNDIWLNNGLLKVNPDEFIVIDEVAGHLLADSQTEITFAHKTRNGWTPGITNNQLLTILCERFKEEPKKVEILKALMNS